MHTTPNKMSHMAQRVKYAKRSITQTRTHIPNRLLRSLFIDYLRFNDSAHNEAGKS